MVKFFSYVMAFFAGSLFAYSSVCYRRWQDFGDGNAQTGFFVLLIMTGVGLVMACNMRKWLDALSDRPVPKEK